MDGPATTRPGKEIFFYFLCLCKESNPRKHTEETEVSSGSFLGALKVSFGNTRIGIREAHVRHHLASTRRASVRSALARRFQVHLLQ